MQPHDHTPDYVWHFKLPEAGAPTAGEGDALTAMVREQVAALLRCLTFTSNGVAVNVTGFRFLDQPERDYQIRPAPSDVSESQEEVPADEHNGSPLGGGEHC
jgi:hypothetical protein